MTLDGELKLNPNYPPVTRGVVVVWGLMASAPYPGMTWHRMQYLAGVRRLGFDVWYVEDSDRSVQSPTNFDTTAKYQANVEYLDRYMKAIGLGDRWIFRPPNRYDICVGGRDLNGLARLYEEAEVVINHSGAQEVTDRHRKIRTLVYLETDPVEKQVAVAEGVEGWIEFLDLHHHFLTFGENLGQPDCLVPIERYKWIPTRPAIVVDWWSTTRGPTTNAALTTIGTFENKGKDVRWNGMRWSWSKHHEFLKFVDLPRSARLPLEVAVGAADPEIHEMLSDHGWRVREAWDLKSPSIYRNYIWDSLGEFTVAKEQYVAPRSGWFSDRSATFLAAGRPVITQETGFSKFIPEGEGLFGFTTAADALAAIDQISGDYQRHSSAASDIANEYFDAEKVIRKQFEAIGLL